MSTCTEIRLAKRPTSTNVTDDLFEVAQCAVPTAGADEILVRQTHMSLDPAMLGWMSADQDSYIPRVELGEVMRSSGFGEVVQSNHPDFAVGDNVMGMIGWREYLVSSGAGLNKVQPGMDPEMALSIFALPGLTATQGLYAIGKPQPGETLVVTGAAGSVGSIVGQLGKAEGLSVIGVAGSDEKCGWIVDELGFDGAINYKSDDLAGQLKALTPNGVDVYFENTGGPIQQQVFNRMNAHGRIAVCGMIADYGAAKPSPGPNWITVIKKRLIIQGFTMPDHFAEAPALLAKLTPHVMAGKIKHRAHVIEGLTSAISGMNLLFTGGNKGKLIVKL